MQGSFSVDGSGLEPRQPSDQGPGYCRRLCLAAHGQHPFASRYWASIAVAGKRGKPAQPLHWHSLRWLVFYGKDRNLTRGAFDQWGTQYQ